MDSFALMFSALILPLSGKIKVKCISLVCRLATCISEGQAAPPQNEHAIGQLIIMLLRETKC